MGLLFVPLALVGGLASIATQQTNGAIGGAAISRLRGPGSLSRRGMGFVFGAIGAWIYTLIAKRLGGIEIQLAGVAITSF
jgi:hypothetical protein